METLTTDSGSVRLRRVENFALASGYFVLNETSMRGEVPRDDPQLLELYRAAESIRAKAYYEIPKHCVSTPFGYWVNAQNRQKLEAVLSELEETAETYNQLAEGRFQCLVNAIYVEANPADPVLRRRMCSFTIEQLQELREKMLTKDPKRHAKTLQYTHDTTRRLDMYLTGLHAKAVRDAVESAKELAHEVRVGERSSIEEKDVRPIDAAIALFERCAAEVQ